MVSSFGSLWRGAYPALEASFGEANGFRLDPMAPAGDVNARPGLDASRASVTFTAIFDAEPAAVSVEGRGGSVSWTEPMITAPPRLDVARAAFASMPRAKDRIARLSTGDIYVISEVRVSDLGRLTIYLNKA